MIHWVKLRRIAPSLAALALLTACNTSNTADSEPAAPPVAQDQPDQMSEIRQQAGAKKVDPHQDQALKKDTVSKADYDQAVANARTCMTDRGVKVGPLVTNRIDGWRQLYTIDWPEGMSADEGSKHSGHCQDHFVAYVERAYAAGNPGRMDPAVRQKTLACLGDRGKKITDKDVNHHQMASSTGLAQEDIADCIVTAMTAQHPDEQFAIVW